MNAPRIVIPIAALLVAAPLSASAQEGLPVAPGDRVRVTLSRSEPDRLIGSVLQLRADSVVLALENRADPLALSLADLTKLEVGRGKESRFGRGLGIGFVAGSITGFALGATVGSNTECGSTDFFCPDPGMVMLGGFLAGGLAGALIGGTIGSLSTSDRWQEVPLDEIRVGPSPVAADGLALSATLRW